MTRDEILSPDMIRKYGWHLKTMGAYVQQPNPAIVGLDDNIIIASNDAAALYPTTGVFQNLGYDTLRDRIYDANIVEPIFNLLTQVFEARESNPGIKDSALFGFKNALNNALNDFLKRKSVPNKKEAREFSLEYYPILLQRLLDYEGSLQEILRPSNDKQYYLLKSCLYPILETVTWLSPQNRGYNQTVLDYIFFNESFEKDHGNKYFVFREINTTKTYFEVLDLQGIKELFGKRILNSYGTLYNRHKDKLSFEVEITKESLAKRRVVKNQMLVLAAIEEHYKNIPLKFQEYFLKPANAPYLSKEQANDILDAIKDEQNRENRIKSLCEIEFRLDDNDQIYGFISLRSSQLNILQLGIKVALNSGYGIFAMQTWLYATPLIGNSFTNAGKIFGTKLFQAVSTDILEKL
jgi:DNA polymerase elongation subunit (family B)